MIRIVVIEDESLARDELVSLLEEMPGVQVVAKAENGRLGLTAIAECKPDAVFLDIEMPGMKGTELMQMLPEPKPALVFVTAYAEHAVKAFEGGALHYLLKPVTRIGLSQAMARIRPSTDPLLREWLRIPVKRRSGMLLLRPEVVDALVADLGDAVAWTAEGKLPVDGSLNHWTERLAEHGFLRVHRNALIRLNAVIEMTAEDELVLPSGRIAISRRRMEEVRLALGID